MTRPFSVYLDLLRFLAAAIVLISHLAYPRFTRGDLIILREWNIGSDAVILFFVLSGLVIAYAAERDAAMGRFAFNRATRLFSVMIPALFLTYALDGIGSGIDPERYDGWWWNPLPLHSFLFYGLTFSNEWGLSGIRLGTNGPLWSLSYEAGYYLLFGAAMFLLGAGRIVVLLLIAVVIGHQVLALLPCWLLGVYVWRKLRTGAAQQMAPLSAWVCVLALPVAYVLAQAIELPTALKLLTAQLLHPWPIGSTLRFSDEVIWNTLLAFLTAAHLLGMARLLGEQFTWPGTAWIRWAAGASFSIYVIHYPLLQFVHALLPLDMMGRDITLLLGVSVLCFGFAALFERRLGMIRGMLKPKAAPE